MSDIAQSVTYDSGVISVHPSNANQNDVLKYTTDNKTDKLQQPKNVNISTTIDSETVTLVINNTTVGQPIILIPSSTFNEFTYELGWSPLDHPIQQIDIVLCSKVYFKTSDNTTKPFMDRLAVPKSIDITFGYTKNGTSGELKINTVNVSSDDIKKNSNRGDEFVYSIPLTNYRGSMKGIPISGMTIKFTFDSTINNGITQTPLKKICPIAAIVPTCMQSISADIIAPPPAAANLTPGSFDKVSVPITTIGEDKTITMTPIYSSLDNVVNGLYSYDNLFDSNKRAKLNGLQITEYGYGYAWQPVGSNRTDFIDTKVKTNNPHNDNSIHILAVADKPFVMSDNKIVNGFPRASLRKYYKEAGVVKTKIYYVTTQQGSSSFTTNEQTSLGTIISTLNAFSTSIDAVPTKWTNIQQAITTHNGSAADNLKIQTMTFKSVSLKDDRDNIKSEFINPVNGLSGKTCHVDTQPTAAESLYVNALSAITTNNTIDNDLTKYKCDEKSMIDSSELQSFLSLHPNVAIIAVEFIIESITNEKQEEYERLVTPSIFATTAAEYTFKLYTSVSDPAEYVASQYCDGAKWIPTNYYLKRASYLSITELIVKGKYVYG